MSVYNIPMCVMKPAKCTYPHMQQSQQEPLLSAFNIVMLYVFWTGDTLLLLMMHPMTSFFIPCYNSKALATASSILQFISVLLLPSTVDVKKSK